MPDERTDRDGGDGRDDEDDRNPGAVETDERVIELLRTADRPRQLASDVAAALDIARGRARTRLQALADEARVVRTRTGTTARWAVPERADEPDPVTEAEENGSQSETDAVVAEPESETDAVAAEPRSGADATRNGSVPADGNGSDTGPAEEPSGTAATDEGDGEWRPGFDVVLALAVGTVLALAAIRRLRRR